MNIQNVWSMASENCYTLHMDMKFSYITCTFNIDYIEIHYLQVVAILFSLSGKYFFDN